jgi:hypothetical protein
VSGNRFAAQPKPWPPTTVCPKKDWSDVFAFITLFFNGVVAHNRKELNGSPEHRVPGTYKRR